MKVSFQIEQLFNKNAFLENISHRYVGVSRRKLTALHHPSCFCLLQLCKETIDIEILVWHIDLVSLGRGVARDGSGGRARAPLPRNLANQFTLFKQLVADYTHHNTACPPPPDTKSYLHLC